MRPSLVSMSVCALLTLGLLVAPSKNLAHTTPRLEEDGLGLSRCEFPESWHGQWLHLGFPQPLNISQHFISSKGTCLRKKGAKFIVTERYNCVKCMVIHEKHSNVLQYKESFCDTLIGRYGLDQNSGWDSQASLDELCQSIESDSALFFMFRDPPNPSKCSFEGVHAFSYSTRDGKDVCSSDPPSSIDSCTNPSKMVLKFQACPDVPGSETNDEIMECIAGWKEGSSRYLVARVLPLAQDGLTSGGYPSPSATALPSYQCFRYENHFEQNRIVIKMSQSYRGSCEGLWSAMEGDKTYTLWHVDTELQECGLPWWLSRQPIWTSLDGKMELSLMGSGGSRRFNLTSRTAEGPNMTSHLTCHHLIHFSDRSVKLVAYHKLECTSGYRCFEINSLHRNVVKIKIGNQSRHADEACSQHFFASKAQKSHLFFAKGQSHDCPFLGKFEQIGPNHQKQISIENGRQSMLEETHCRGWFQSGCPLGSNLVMNLCKFKQDQAKDYTCLADWPESDESRRRVSSRISPIRFVGNQSELVEYVDRGPSFLLIQERSGTARCVKFTAVSGGGGGGGGHDETEQLRIEVRLMQDNCDAVHMISGYNDHPSDVVVFGFRGACQEALTDSASIAAAAAAVHLPLPTSLLLLILASLNLAVKSSLPDRDFSPASFPDPCTT